MGFSVSVVPTGAPGAFGFAGVGMLILLCRDHPFTSGVVVFVQFGRKYVAVSRTLNDDERDVK